MLEAVLIVSVMVSAVAFVVTFEQPQPSTFNARTGLETTAQDILDVLHDSPVGEGNFGDNELSAYIALCLNDRCEKLEEKLAKLVPPGASYALEISNGYATYPVLVKGEPIGEAISGSRTFQPGWSSTWLATASEAVNPQDALLVYALPMFHSMPVSGGGSQILVKVSGYRDDGSDYVLIASASTVAMDEDDPTAIAASMYFVSDLASPVPNAPLPVLEMTDASDGVPRRLILRVEETEGGEIPAGAEVAVHMPRGWTASAPAAENPSWTIVSEATDDNGASVGSSVRASLKSPPAPITAGPNGQVDLLIDVVYHGDVLDYYPIVATLSKGAHAMASVLVRGEVHDTEPALATPALHLSVPSPMGSGAQTTWTLTAHIPANTMPDGSSALVHVHTVELIEQEGNPIFGAEVTASLGEAMGGTWKSTGSQLTWNADDNAPVTLDHDTPLNLTFRVAASGTPGPSEIRSHFVPPIQFDEWTGRLVGRTGWGFYRQAILPDNADYEGYNAQAAPLGLDHTLSSPAVYRQTELPGEIPYTVSLTAALQDALYGSYVTADDRTVPIGGHVVINANVESVLFALSKAGQKAGVTLRFYPPWSGNERVWVHEQPNLDQGLLTGEVAKLVAIDLNDDGFPDPVVGTSNGRIIAYHGLTGQRLQGNTFTVPLAANAEEQAVPRITALATVELYGKEYIVVGTDKNSEGVFVLDKELDERWRYEMGADVLAIDVSTDFDGDAVPEIVVARSYETGAAKNAFVYVLKAPNDPAETALVALRANSPPAGDNEALFLSLGTPSTVLSVAKQGPRGLTQGIFVPVQTSFDPGLQHNTEDFPPTVTRGASSSPRAGLQGVNEYGETTGLLFGTPASVVRDYEYDRDKNGVRDVVVGGASGYVVLANGSVLTQPIYSYIMSPTSEFISADTRSSAESYALTSQGLVYWTDDAWVSSHGPDSVAVGAKAISSNAYNSYWVVGEASQVWRSVPSTFPWPEDPGRERYPEARELELVTIDALHEDELHTFRDVHFRGDKGIIVGTACIPVERCAEPILLTTEDGGETWLRHSIDNGLLLDRDDGMLTKDIRRVKVMADTTGWMVGDGGLIARNLTDSKTWKELDTAFTYNLRDIDCVPGDYATCMVVGDAGAAFLSPNARDEEPTWYNMTGVWGLPERTLFSIGMVDSTRGYIGSENMVLGRFGGEWTALPLNYFENNANVVSTNGDGTGFIYGGTPATGRVWLLHDYHTQSQAQSKSFASEFPNDAKITQVKVVDGDITFAQQTILLNVTTNGGAAPGDWKSVSLVTGVSDPNPPFSGIDPRKPVERTMTWSADNTGNDLRFRIVFNTSSDKTVLSPHIRSLKLRADFTSASGPDFREIHLDLTSRDQVDDKMTSADWNVSAGVLRQPLVQEFWTRNVRGQVHDIQTGFDLDADEYDEIWVATGDVLAENSPDYIAYAGTDMSKYIESENRVYLLSGMTGSPLAMSEKLAGEVRHLRLVDMEGDGPEILFATTWDPRGGALAKGYLYALDPGDLSEIWKADLGRQVPSAIEPGHFPGPTRVAFVGGQRPSAQSTEAPSLRAIDEVSHDDAWEVLPDDLGKYNIKTKVQPGWFFGPHVVEIEVNWEETITDEDVPEGTTVLRSARFYDHFMVTQPDAVGSPNPVYTARLLMWMRDWG